MRIYFLLILLTFVQSVAFSQKVTIKVIRAHETGISDWQILDENQLPVFCGDDFAGNDTSVVTLEAERRYFLFLSSDISFTRRGTLCQVIIDEEQVLTIDSEIGTGEHIFPFYTGRRTDQSKIIGGSSVSISQYPWQVYIVAENYLCGGSIIGPGWVLTAAHCVKHNGAVSLPSDIKITAGSTTPRAYGEKFTVAEVIVHEQYNVTNLENDIALLRTEDNIICTDCKPIKLVNAINVEEGFTDPGTMATITGWGLTRTDPDLLPINLMMAQVPIVSSQTASVIWKAIPSTCIMAGYKEGNKDVCSGDSGGPLTVTVDGESKIAGITSWGSGDCDTYSGYTRVSTLESWIRSKTGIVDYTLDVPQGDSVVCQGTLTSDYTAEVVSGATEYEWELVPSGSGTITWTSNNASVSWNNDFIGNATVKARVILNGSYSEWGRRSITRALNTRVIDEPEDIVLCENDTLDMKIVVEGAGLEYDWYYNEGLIFGGHSDTLNISGVVPQNSGTYRCLVTGLCGSISTRTIDIIVHPLTHVNNISPDISTDYGSNIVLEVNASGHELTYQWKQNNRVIENGNSSFFEITDADAENIGLYRSVVSGTCGIKTSDPVYVYLKNEENITEKVNVWPTIISDEVNVAISTNDEYGLQIISSSGKLMHNSVKCRYQTTLNISNFPKGFYILRIASGDFKRSVKVIKK